MTAKQSGLFANARAFSSFSTPDLDQARDFYANKLGLDVRQTPEGIELHLLGGTTVFVYPSTDYTAPEHTVLNFPVDDIDEAIDALAEQGIRMEQYDWPEIKTDRKGIFRGGHGPKAIAWFKDPAGHILSVLQEK